MYDALPGVSLSRQLVPCVLVLCPWALWWLHCQLVLPMASGKLPSEGTSQGQARVEER